MFLRNSVRRSRKSAFTLVELLVVIGIIALLIAILMPSLRKAREAAITTACLSNLRQIGLGIQMYANESKGWFPSGGPNRDFRLKAPTSGVPPLSWPDRLVLHGAIRMNIPDSRWTSGGSYPTAGQGVFLCPGWGYGALEGGSTRIDSRGYGMPLQITPDFGSSPYKAAFTKIHRIPRNKVILVDGYMRLGGMFPQYCATNRTDQKNWQNLPMNTTPSQFGIFLRHSKGANYLFPDMHAEWSNVFHRTGHATHGSNNVWNVDSKIFIPVREWTSGD